jgi:hypothetical protein
MAEMPRSVSYRVVCPVCGGWAQLRVVPPFGAGKTEPVIMSFTCQNAMIDGHGRPGIKQLRDLLALSGEP